MRARALCHAFVFALLACAGCGRKAADTNAPLAFVPADTPYLFANAEPMSDATIAAWQSQARAMWPPVRDLLQQSLETLERTEADAAAAKVLQFALDELGEGDPATWWQRAGFDPKSHMAIYGIDLWPVLRVELADPAAFEALVARVEQKAGTPLGTARIGEQAVRTFGDAKMQGLLAIEGKHLVVTFAPGDADEALKRRLLGIDRPATAFDVSELERFNKAHGYLPIGSGWLDTRRAVALALQHAPDEYADATCKAEVESLAAKAPRLGMGYRAFDATRMAMHARIELEPALAKSLSALAAPLPGTADADALFDFAIAMPVLRARDFLRTQVDAAIAAPYKCAALAKMNDDIAELKTRLAQTIPPPVRDFTGARIALSRLAWAEGSDNPVPDFAGRFVLGTNNPEFLTSLAQVSVPALAALTIAKDGKPVAIPPAALPASIGNVDLHVAMGANALGVAFGKDEAARLTPAVTTAAPADGAVLVSSMRGAMYASFADAMGRFGASLPAEMHEQIESQRRFYGFYAKWLKRADVRVALTAEGIDFSEEIEFATLPPATAPAQVAK